MERLRQDPTEDGFVQDPYPFYDRLRLAGPLAWWEEYGMPVSASHAAVSALLRDRRFGREDPAPPPRPAHQAAFWAVEDHSMLEAEPPRHTRLRAQVLRAFTSRRVAAMEAEIEALAHALIDALPDGPCDLIARFCQPLPVRVIARLLGLPEADAPRLLGWSHAMVGMYQAGRTEAHERAAAHAAGSFRAHLAGALDARARAPRDDLLSHLLAVERDGRLGRDETLATAILLLNAGHEATVHALGNAVHGLLRRAAWPPRADEALVEEALRHDPPLHLFARFANEDCEAWGHRFRRGDRVGLLLAAADRDPAAHPDPARFDPARRGPAPLAFGAGIHFCLGAPLARLELRVALGALARRRPALRPAGRARYAPVYHFHGLASLPVDPGGGTR